MTEKSDHSPEATVADVTDDALTVAGKMIENAKLAGITLTDDPPHPTWKIELLGDQTCQCGETLTVGNLLTFCPRYRRIGDDHVLRPNPRVVDSRGNLVRADQ